MELKGKKINFLGDSITAGVGPSSREFHFLNVMKEKEHLAEARNYGIGSSRIARQTEFNGESEDFAFVDRYYKMDDDADIIVVFGGTNDYGHGNSTIGRMEDRDPTTFYGACHLLMEGLMNKYPAATIVFVTPLQRAVDRHVNMIHPSKYNCKLLDYVNIIKEVAQYYSIPVLDLYAKSNINPNIEKAREMYSQDGLHPNDKGNAIIASRLTNFLKSL